MSDAVGTVRREPNGVFDGNPVPGSRVAVRVNLKPFQYGSEAPAAPAWLYINLEQGMGVETPESDDADLSHWPLVS